tara:strand:+ start:961 stop:1128 length:168 start_codon:yes stop_codon:yes gene_type:complete
MNMIEELEMRERILKGLIKDRLDELYASMPHLTKEEQYEVGILHFELENFRNSEL